MISLLEFVNRIRTLIDLTEMPCIWLTGTAQDDEANCIVATALGLPVGQSENLGWSAESRWVMRMPDRATARLVGIVTDLDWRADPPEVALPDEVIDLAVSHHFAAVESDDIGVLAAWWVL